VVLNRRDREGFVAESSHGAVIDVAMGDDTSRSLQRSGFDAKTVVLACNLNPTPARSMHRLVGTPMPKFHFGRLSPQCQAEELVPQADSEGWNFTGDFFEGQNGLINGCGIPRTIADEKTFRLKGPNGLWRAVGRQCVDFAPPIDQVLENGSLGSTIQRDHPERATCVRGPAHGHVSGTIPPPIQALRGLVRVFRAGRICQIGPRHIRSPSRRSQE
jgi:hypothetical protein